MIRKYFPASRSSFGSTLTRFVFSRLKKLFFPVLWWLHKRKYPVPRPETESPTRDEFIETCQRLPRIRNSGWQRLYVGRRGVAKTYTGTRHILNWLKKGEAVAVNWNVHVEPWQRHLYYRWREPEELIGLENCHVFIDESQAEFNSRDYINMTPEVQQWVREMRHWDLTLDLFVQVFTDLDKTFREQVDEVLWIHRIGTRRVHIPFFSNIIVYWEHERIMHSLNEEALWEPISFINWLMDAMWMGGRIGYLDRKVFRKYNTKVKGLLEQAIREGKKERRAVAQTYIEAARKHV